VKKGATFGTRNFRFLPMHCSRRAPPRAQMDLASYTRENFATISGHIRFVFWSFGVSQHKLD
jgi:hypothetical protein